MTMLQKPSMSSLVYKLRPLLIGCVLFTTTATALFFAGLRYNVSPSLPRGLYIRTIKSPLVSVCPTSETRSRLYRLPGNCPDSLAPLLKHIAARQGDYVQLGREGVRVNGVLIRNSQPRTTDSHGRRLHPYPYGRYKIPAGRVWLASSYEPLSFDSRYFGPVLTSEIEFALKPLLTW